MKYIINGSISFNIEDGTLFHQESDDQIILPLPAQRLLIAILDSRGEILRRDDLIETIWERYGLTGSGNNLNQYLSLLRRSIATFGCEVFVETIPKVGLQLCKDVQVEMEQTSEIVLALNVPGKNEEQNKADTADDCPQGVHHGLPVMAVFLVSILAAAVGIGRGGYDPELIEHAMSGGCNLVTFFSLGSKEQNQAQRNTDFFLQNIQKSCEPGTTVYYDANASRGLTISGRTLMTYCKSNTNGEDEKCVNSYYFNGVVSEK